MLLKTFSMASNGRVSSLNGLEALGGAMILKILCWKTEDGL